MTELQVGLNVVLSNTYVMFFKAHSFHWNVEGKRFYMYHQFFKEIYDELFSAIDVIAENIRTIDEYGPYSLKNVLKYATIKEEDDVITSGNGMIYLLIEANEEVINSLETCFGLAEEQNDQGLMDLLATRLSTHKKYAWMLKSTDKEEM